MRRIGLAAFLAAASVTLTLGQTAKKRVAVLDFDNAAAQGGATIMFMETTSANVGKAVTDLLITRLVRGAAVSVIERMALDKLIAEQNLTNSDRTDPLTAAKLGRILGVDAIVLGSITHYAYDDKTTGGGGGFGGFIGRGSMSTKHDIKAVVQISARVVSPDTAEVLSVSQGNGEVAKKGVKVDMRDMSSVMAMGVAGANNPIMKEATDKAVEQLAAHLETNFAKLPPRVPVIDALVADVNESGRLVLNVGSKDGVKTGDRLQIWRMGKEIRDPASGKVLLREDTLLGEAAITTVHEISSIAMYNGDQPAKTGDLAKSFPRQK